LKAVPGRTLIFTETKRDTDILARFLFSHGFQASAIHGDRSQREREAALNSFKSGRITILVATDVASRGLDINGVCQVVNYDMPGNIDSYVHRIGRTGRAGHLGVATSYFTDENKGLSKKLVKVLVEANQIVPDWLNKMSMDPSLKANKSGRFGGKMGGGNRFSSYRASAAPYGYRPQYNAVGPTVTHHTATTATSSAVPGVPPVPGLLGIPPVSYFGYSMHQPAPPSWW